MAHAGPPPSHAAPHTSGTVLVSSFVCRSCERPLTTRSFPQEQPPEQPASQAGGTKQKKRGRSGGNPNQNQNWYSPQGGGKRYRGGKKR